VGRNKKNILFMNSLSLSQMEEISGGGWWASWGKCAAGIVGGAGLGGLAGGAAGSVIPVLGTGIGAGIGAVSGALSGAAAAC
jgi:hypothetical protein